DFESVTVGNLSDGAHVAHLTVKVDRQNCARAICNCCLDIASIEVTRLGFYVDKYWRGAGLHDGCRGGNEGHWRRNHFVSWSYSQCEQCQVQCASATCNGHGVSHAQIVRKTT